MTERETVDNWLSNIAATIGAPALRLDDQGLCACRYDDVCEVTVEVPDGAGQVFFYAALQHEPPTDREALYRHLLELNAYMIGSRGGALGLDAQSGEIVLSRAEPIEALSEDLFGRMLANFVNAAKTLQVELATFPAPDQARSGGRRADSSLTVIQV